MPLILLFFNNYVYRFCVSPIQDSSITCVEDFGVRIRVIAPLDEKVDAHACDVIPDTLASETFSLIRAFPPKCKAKIRLEVHLKDVSASHHTFSHR